MSMFRTRAHGRMHDNRGLDPVIGVPPIGSIIMQLSTQGIPNGWLKADGTNGTTNAGASPVAGTVYIQRMR